MEDLMRAEAQGAGTAQAAAGDDSAQHATDFSQEYIR